MRVNRRWGPARIGYLLGIHPSTVHRVLPRYRLAKLTWLDGGTGRVIRRYEHNRPGDLVLVDIKSGQGRWLEEQDRHHGQPQARLPLSPQRCR